MPSNPSRTVDSCSPNVDVSIIVSNHNYARFLANAIESALAQRHCRVEVIAVDDGSTDESLAVLEQYSGRVQVISTPCGGQGAAMNRGFAQASGEAILFLDSDDELMPDAAANAARALRDNPGVSRVQFPMTVIDAAGKTTGGQIPSDPRSLARGDLRTQVLTFPDDLCWQPTSGNGFRAGALRRIMPIPEAEYRISADHYLLNLTGLLGDIMVLDEPGAKYRVHGGNNDHRGKFDLDRHRSIVERTIVTHRALHDLARSEGAGDFPADPLDVLSVTFVANRLISLRMSPENHPIPGDTRSRLLWQGLRAAWFRMDVTPSRRVAFAGWIFALTVAPRSVAAKIANATFDRANTPMT